MSDPIDHYSALRPIAEQMARILEHGCSDHHCRMVKRKRGQGTNGGCRCIRDLNWIGKALVDEADKVSHFCTAIPVFDRTSPGPEAP